LKKKRRFAIIGYVSIIIVYLSFSLYNLIGWKIDYSDWRKDKINSSPTVYITKTGHMYHNSYHYSKRNEGISLFEAVEKGYEPCNVCHPVSAPSYNDAPIPPNWFLKNWFLVSLIISCLYWSGYLIYINRINKTQ
jgi:hypothetical protein